MSVGKTAVLGLVEQSKTKCSDQFMNDWSNSCSETIGLPGDGEPRKSSGRRRSKGCARALRYFVLLGGEKVYMQEETCRSIVL